MKKNNNDLIETSVSLSGNRRRFSPTSGTVKVDSPDGIEITIVECIALSTHERINPKFPLILFNSQIEVKIESFDESIISMPSSIYGTLRCLYQETTLLFGGPKVYTQDMIVVQMNVIPKLSENKGRYIFNFCFEEFKPTFADRYHILIVASDCQGHRLSVWAPPIKPKPLFSHGVSFLCVCVSLMQCVCVLHSGQIHSGIYRCNGFINCSSRINNSCFREELERWWASCREDTWQIQVF